MSDITTTHRHHKSNLPLIVVFASAVLMAGFASSAAPAADWATIGPSPADKELERYFRSETAKLAERCLRDITGLDDFKAKRPAYKAQLLEMLGLDPLPEKTPLHAVVTGKVEHDEFFVEKVHFQSRPRLYVTGNLYVPRDLEKPAPAILYVCGHGAVKKNGISYGNKVHYQHHGAWFARHGYVCLVIDSLQLGEIEAIHHGTYRYKMWWWNCRGYTPAGVEAWNCIRALDYLETRKEVDKERFGVTGRSGGGAYSWWIAAIDERIKVAVPVAGITDLQNHVVDGCVEGHCDCMYFVNTYRRDYCLLPALVAPRPLLISNSDKDRIFPLDGVVRIYNKTREIYGLYDAAKNLGLNITEGPHKDTQELRIHAFVWFDRFLKGQTRLIDKPAVPFFEPEQLKVFDKLPEDQVNTKIHHSFVPAAGPPAVPQSPAEWAKQCDCWITSLKQKVFRGWPTDDEAGPIQPKQTISSEKDGLSLTAYEFDSQPHVRLRLYVVAPEAGKKTRSLTLTVLDEQLWSQLLAAMAGRFEQEPGAPNPPAADAEALAEICKALEAGRALAFFAPRGIGPYAWNRDERKQTQIRRRFMLLGQTLDGMRVWDVRRAVRALRSIKPLRRVPLTLQARQNMAGIALYAALFEPDVQKLNLWDPPASHHDGPILLNVLRYLDMPQAVAMAAERCDVRLFSEDDTISQFAQQVIKRLGRPGKRLQRLVPKANQNILTAQ